MQLNYTNLNAVLSIYFYEAICIFTLPISATFHGSDGEITISPASYAPIAKYFVAAAEEIGYHKIDLNAPYQEGKRK